MRGVLLFFFTLFLGGRGGKSIKRPGPSLTHACCARFTPSQGADDADAAALQQGEEEEEEKEDTKKMKGELQRELQTAGMLGERRGSSMR